MKNRKRSNKPKLTTVSRAVLESVARVLGTGSAAAQALADADSFDGETRFYRLGSAIIVEKVPTVLDQEKLDAVVATAVQDALDPSKPRTRIESREQLEAWFDALPQSQD